MTTLSSPFTKLVHGRPWVGGVKSRGPRPPETVLSRLSRVYKRSGGNYHTPDLYWIPGTVLVPVATENDFETARSLLHAARPAVGDTSGILFLDQSLSEQFRHQASSLARENIQLVLSGDTSSPADSLGQRAHDHLKACGERTRTDIAKQLSLFSPYGPAAMSIQPDTAGKNGLISYPP